MKGKLIVIEGTDCSGKETQANLLEEKLNRLGRQTKKLYFPKSAGWFVLVLSILIGLSRLYVGVHYPTDVLGGAIIAIADAAVVFAVYKKFFIRK